MSDVLTVAVLISWRRLPQVALYLRAVKAVYSMHATFWHSRSVKQYGGTGH